MAGYTRRKYAGAATPTTITANMTSVSTTITIAAYTGWTSDSTKPFYVVVDPGKAAEEKILVTRTGATDTTLNVVTRGVDGTTATSHSSGASVYPVFTSVDADEANEVASTLTTKGDLLTHTGSAHARTGVGANNTVLVADSAQTNGIKWASTLAGLTLTAPVISSISNTGTVTLPTATDTLVGRATTDTLTNKTIALGSNTVSGTLAQFNTAVTDADLVSLAGTETLTNKTLTAPVISTISNTGTVTLPTSTDTLVGRATTDTLTNKTIALGSNTISGTLAQFNTAVTDADLASIAGTETLTNKTLTSPTIAGGTNTASILVSPEERWTVSATAATGTVNVDLSTTAAWLYTTNASANWTFNFRGNGSTTLSSLLATGDSVTVAFAVTNGSTAYYPTAFQIDGSAVTPKWQGGTAPTAGSASSIDLYVFTIIKTAATPTYTVFAAQTKFA